MRDPWMGCGASPHTLAPACAFLLSLLVPAMPAAAQSVVANPSFEVFGVAMEPTDWSRFNRGVTSAVILSSGGWSTDGGYSLELSTSTAQPGNVDAGVDQAIDLTNVTRLVFDFHLAVESSGQACGFNIGIEGCCGRTYQAAGTYLDEELDVSGMGGVRLMHLSMGWGASGGGPQTGYFDNFRASRSQDLLRSTRVTFIRPVTPPLASVLPLDPAIDFYRPSVVTGDLDPDSGVLPDTRRPLVFYGLDAPDPLRLPPLRLLKTAAGRIQVDF